jgi:hypothetical protein
MSRDLEELLREGIDRATATTDGQAPATLLHRARRHNRRRRQAITAAIAAGSAAVAAIATSLSVTVTTALPGQTITYVTTQAERALAQLDPSRAIETSTLTAHNGDFGFTVLNTAYNGQSGSTAQVSGVLGDVHASSEVDWSYDGLYLQHGYSAAGKLVYTVTGGPQGISGAAYPDRVRWHNSLAGGQSGPNPSLTCDNAGTGYPDWNQSITKALSCHLFTLGGDEQIDGIDTIKLTGKPMTAQGQTFRQTLWVDPKTYLPLLTTTTFTQPHHRAATLISTFHWLSPTRANLARLHAASGRSTIPAAFRPLPPAYVPLPGFNGPLR